MQGKSNGISEPEFAHPVEARFAALLDACGVAWEYEPHAFVLERDALGRPVEAFVPDFYLPELDMYIECTVMKPAHATRKRRKVRRAVERYGVLVTLQERGDLERLVREYRPSAPEAAGGSGALVRPPQRSAAPTPASPA